MAVLKDTSGGTSGTASGTTLTSASLTVANNSNRALYAWVFTGATTPPTCSAVNWNTSEAMTQLATVLQTSVRGYLFRLKNPTAATATITATISASADGWAIFWFSGYNVDQTTSESTARTNSATAGAKWSVGFEGFANGISLAAALGGNTVSALASSDGIPFWVASGTQQTSSAVASLTVSNAPATQQIGDLEYCTLTKENTATASVSGSGWVKTHQTTFGTSRSTAYAYRIYDGTNVNPAWSWTGSVDAWGRRHAFRDTQPSGTSMAVLGTLGSGTGTTHTSTGANTTQADVLAMYSDECNANTALGAPGGSWTERWDAGSATGPSRTAGGTQPIATSGTGSGNLSMTGGGTAWIQQQWEVYNALVGDQATEDTENNINGQASAALASEAGDVFNAIAFDSTGTVNNWVALGVGLNPASISDITLGITSSAATASPGTLAPSSAVALTGVQASGAVGSVVSSQASSGVQASGDIGTAGVQHDQALTGAVATAAVGTTAPTLSIALSGVEGATAIGTLAPSMSLALTGVAVTGAVGTIEPNITIGLTGVEATGQVGSVTVTASDITLALTGVESLSAVGTFGVQSTTALTGVEALGQAGTLAPSIDNAVTGAAATGTIGALVPSTTVGLVGVEAPSAVGTVTVPGDVTIALTGVEALGQIGTLTYQVAAIPVATPSEGAVGGGAFSSIDQKPQKQRKKEDDELTKTIRSIYRRLANSGVPSIAAKAEAIVAAITPQVRAPKIDVPKNAARKAEIEARIEALTAEKISIESEIALRMADQELARKQAQRAENMRRIHLILQVI